MKLNDNFKEDISKKGEVGVKWLKEIPEIIKYLEKKWDIKAGKLFDIYFNYVISATRNNGSNVVLKIVFPSDKQFQSEVDALNVFNGDGCVKLLEVNQEQFAMLLEKAEPGLALNPWGDDEKATRIIASIIKKMNKPVPDNHHFTYAADFAKEIFDYKQNYRGAKNPLPGYLVDKTEELITHLVKTSTKLVVNHGDLHYGNILTATREPWLSIDPKGIVAEPTFETGAMLRNPYPELTMKPNLEHILTRRIQILAQELNLDPIRIQQWALVQSVLGAIWRIEDYGTHWEHSIKFAEILDKIKL